MGLKDLHLKLKAFRLRRLLLGSGQSKKRHQEFSTKKPLWMMPISHGCHVVEDQSFRGGHGSGDSADSDSVVVQREQIEELELWFFGVFDARIGDGVTKHVQSHLLDRKPKESQITRKSKETMRKACLGARAKVREAQKDDDDQICRVGSASVIVINREKLVIANMGDYKAIVCRGGEAHQISSSRHSQNIISRHWSRRLFPVRILARNSGNAEGTPKQFKSSELAVGAQKMDSDTEFVIIASNGIWEVMKNQEAVGLIRHMEDPQEAAECLAKEALTRMSKSNISCVVIRFD